MEWLKQIIDSLLSIFPRLLTVNPDEAGCRITLGKYVKPIGSGWYIYWPLLQDMLVITVTAQVKDARVQSVWTKDKCDLCIGLAIKYRIKDAEAAQLKIQDYDQSLQNSALVACIEYVTEYTKDDIIVLDVNESLTKILQAKARGWGIDVQDVSITDIGRTKNIRILGNEKVIPLENE